MCQSILLCTLRSCEAATLRSSPVIHNCNGSTVCHVHVPIKRILCLDIVNHTDQIRGGSGGLGPYLQIRPRPSMALRGIFCKLVHNPWVRQMTMQLLPRSERCKGGGVGNGGLVKTTWRFLYKGSMGRVIRASWSA